MNHGPRTRPVAPPRRAGATAAPSPAESPSAIQAMRLRNALHRQYFEFAPQLLRHLTYDELKARPRALKDVELELSPRMERCLGMCYPEKRRIALNEPYFLRQPHYLPYTLYHEMVHMLLFDAGRPWGHTREFYAIMEEFPEGRHPRDPNVHIHMRQARAGQRLKRDRDEEKSREETLSQFIERVFGRAGGDGAP